MTTASPTLRLSLVRHGQSPSNLRTLLDTAAPGPGLTELGHAQALTVARRFLGSADLLMSSHLTRAQETARAVSDLTGLPVLVREELREVMAGDLEMRNDPDALVRYRSTFLEWTRGDLDARIPGGEDGHEVVHRIDAAVAEVVASGAEHAVLVAHGAVIRTWAGLRSSNVTGFYDDPRLRNTGVVDLQRQASGRWTLESWDGEAPSTLAPYMRAQDPAEVLAALSRLDHPHGGPADPPVDAAPPDR